MPDFKINPDKEKNLKDRFSRLGIKETDIDEHFIRSSGPGGQRTNKVSTCVYLKHVPTGIGVKCSKDRSQSINRYIARVLLANKIENMILGKLSEEQKRTEKIRRQKRRRSRKAKNKMLKEKRFVSEKKKLRSTVTDFE